MKILVTGSAGFISGYLIEELLNSDHTVIGIDNFSKYGKSNSNYFNNKNFEFIEGDAKNLSLLKEVIADCDQFVASAAMIGGISYFHELAYDLIAENERIISTAFDAAIWAFNNKKLNKINVISSSMVYESANKFPTKEGDELKIPPPLSTYGFQKLSSEYFAKGAYEQYKLPYTIIRPFNCIGIGEKRAKNDKEVYSGNIKLALSHVVPDIIQKILKGQRPVKLLGDGNQIRHYTYGGDLAKGIRLCIENDRSINQDFNLSTDIGTTVLQLTKKIWNKICPEEEFVFETETPYQYDVQKRIPDVSKSLEILGFKAETKLETALDEIIPWIKNQIKLGNI